MSPDDRVELYVGDDTTASDVIEFLVARTSDPVRFRDGDVVVFNYHNYALDTAAVADWADDADPGIYVVPFQVSGVWTFMHAALPPRIREADYLAYRAGDEEYVDYTNWARVYGSADEEFDDVEDVRPLLDQLLRTATEVLDDV